MLKRITAILLAVTVFAAGCLVGGGVTPVSASEVSSTDIISNTDTVSDSDNDPTPDPDDVPDVPQISFDELTTTLSAKSAGYNSIALSWDAVEGAVSYEVWTATSKSGTYTKKTTVDGTSCTDSGRTINKTYYYKVRAINADGVYTKFSEIVSAKALPAQPQNVKAVRASYRSIKISWSKVSGASGYMIYRATSKNGTYTAYKRITSGSTLSWTNGYLTTGKTYYYKVRAYRTSNGTRIYGPYSDIVSAKPYLSAPSKLTLTRSGYGIIVTWSSVSGATGYRLYRATDPEGEFTLLGTTSSGKRSFNNTSVVPGVTYYYKVVATRNGSEGAATAVKSLSPVMSKPSSPKAASASYNSIKLSWSGVSGATGYVIFRSSTADGTYEEIGRTTSKSYTDSGLTLGTTYYYKIAAYRTSKGLTGVGTKTGYVSAKPALSAPTVSSVKKNSSTALSVNWKQVSGADGYYVYRATSSSGTYTQIGKVESGDTVSYIDDGLTANKTYYYKVRAYRIVDGTEVLSANSAYKSGKITKKVAYLTFDDGPSCNTMEILDILDKYDVKATFFVIGKSGRDKEYKAIVERGHTIALHTYSHNYAKVYASEKAFFAEIQKISDKVYDLTGVRSNIIRFPGGSSNTVYKKYCSGLMAKLKKSVPAKGYYYHDWNVSSGDASGNNISKTRLVNNVKNGCKGKNTVNILMHDTGSSKNTTVDALPAIIKYLLDQGYDIQPITEDSVLIQH